MSFVEHLHAVNRGEMAAVYLSKQSENFIHILLKHPLNGILNKYGLTSQAKQGHYLNHFYLTL